MPGYSALGRLAEIPAARRQAKNWWHLTTGYTLGGSRRFPLVVWLHDGKSFRLVDRAEAAVFWQIFIRRCYEVRPTDRVILDAGANVGLFAVWAAREAPQARVISVEPHPVSVDRLKQVVDSHGLTKRVEVVASALGATSESRWLNDAPEGSISNYIDNENRNVPGRRQVPCTTLAALMDRFGLREVDLLKMDIEASEYETLLAAPVAVLRRIARINVELHVPGPVSTRRRTQLLEYLKEAGFKAGRYDPDSQGTGVAFFDRVGPI